MPVSVIPGGREPSFAQSFLQSLVQSQQDAFKDRQLDQQERQLDLEERRVKILEKKANMQQQAQEFELGSAASPFLNAQQGQPQQMPSLPGAQQQFGPAAATPEVGFPTLPQARQLASPEAQRAIQSRDPVDQAIAGQAIGQRQQMGEIFSLFQSEAERVGDPSIVTRGVLALQLESAGMDASLTREILPPDQKDLYDLEKLRLDVSQAQNDLEADGFATQWLISRGIVPEGSPPISGASDTLLNVVEAREGERIDWMQEGLDFVLGRIGDPSSGSPFAVAPDGSLTLSQGGGVDVEQALTEWKEVARNYAPPEQRDAILERLDSNAFTRRLEISAAQREVKAVLDQAEDKQAAEQQLRDILSGEFGPDTVNEIIKNAKRPRR